MDSAAPTPPVTASPGADSPGTASPASAPPRDVTEDLPETFARLRTEIGRVVEGKDEAIELTLTVLFAGGHLLIEDVPGVGKTMLAKALGRSLGASWSRIQFTPDLLPSDVTGVSVYQRQTGEFVFRPGAVFHQIVLADEINRASPKTQSALLEAMEEQQVSVDSETYTLPSPFMVIATSNPVEMDGTYLLPEAQRDRFLARLTLGYPAAQAEAAMIATQTGTSGATSADVLERVEQVLDASDVTAIQRRIRAVHVSADLLDYVVRLASATRTDPRLALGVSPRGAVHLVRAAKARAALAGHDHVRPQDVRSLAVDVWSHRLHLRPGAGALDAAEVIRDAISSTWVVDAP